MKIPILDLGPVRRQVEAELARRWAAILDTTSFVLGPEVRELEERFAEYLGATGCVAVGNGTDALTVALRALGVGPGDEVVVPAFSFFATAEAVVLAGGTPVFADVEPATLNLDPASLAAKIGERTRAVVVVHLYGRPCRMEPIRELCREHDLRLLEDAAQAHGARRRGRAVGTLGDLAAWSFYPTKNLGCFGDGGAITAGDPERLAEARLLANHGQVARYDHHRVGTNSRLDSLQAAVLNARLPHLDADNARRRELAAIYREGLAGVDEVALLTDDPADEVVYHQLTIRVPRRNELQAHLAAAGIGSAVHYPGALHHLPPMVELQGTPPSLPVAEAAGREVLCLPMHPHLAPDDAREVAREVRRFYRA